METITHTLRTASTVTIPRFGSEDEARVLAINAGENGWGAVLMQVDQKGRRDP